MDYDVGIVKQRRIISPSNSYFSVSGTAASVSFDAIAALQSGSNVGPTQTWTHTPVGTPTAVAVLFNNYTGGPSAGASGVTYGGTAMTLAKTVDNATPSTTEIWGLASPPTGAQSVVVTFNATAGNFFVGSSISVTGSNTVTCFRASNSNSGTGTTSSVTTTSAAGDLVVDFVGCLTTLTVGGSQTERWNGVVGGDHGAGSTLPGASPNVSMTWTLGASGAWGAVAGSFGT